MIVNNTEYNPLKNIFEIMSNECFVTADLDKIHKELFLGGVALENQEELSIVMDLLMEYKKEYNGN